MKTKLKKSNNLDGRVDRPERLWVRILRLTGFAVSLVILLLLFALFAIGLPPHLTRHITAQIRKSGVPVQIESIRLSPHHGWVLNHARIYSTSPDDLQPLLSTEKMYVILWPVNWKSPVNGGWHIKVKTKQLDLSPGHVLEPVLADSPAYRTINGLDVSLIAAPGRIAIDNAALSWNGINILAHGTAAFAEKPSFTKPDAKRDPANVLYYATQVVDTLDQLKFASSPQLNLDFNYNGIRPEETFVNVSLSAKNIFWRNKLYKNLSGLLNYRDTTWTLSPLQLSQSADEALVLQGEFGLDDGIAQISVGNSLAISDVFNLLPETILSGLAQTGIKPYGPIDFTVSAGPAPYTQLAENIEAQIHQAQFSRLDLTLDPLSLHLVRNKSKINVSHMLGRANGEPFSGSFAFDLNTKAWEATVQTQCDPSVIGTLTGGGLQQFIERFRFPNELLKGDLSLSQAGPGESFLVTGTLSGNQFTCGGVPVEHFDAFLVVSNGVVDLTPIHITRGKEQFDGSVQVDLDNEIAFFNATNSFPPADIVQALAPDTRTFLDEIRLDGAILSVGQGRLDYGTWTNHSFQGTVRAENIGYGLVQASNLQAEVKGSGTLLFFNNASAVLYGGTVEGAAEFDLFTDDGAAPYRINTRLTRIDLAHMLKQLSTSDFGQTRGECSATINLTADAKAGFWQSVNGGGQAKIEKGHLADIPLFGGFSRLIQTTFPGFNLFSLTSFSADYNLHEGAIWSDNAKIGGTLFSANGRGSYSPKDGLNFIVAAEPLGQVDSENKEWYDLQLWAADALKMGTAPFFRLLEFQLHGPLNKPEWKFFNLPKEIVSPPNESFSTPRTEPLQSLEN